METSFLAVVLTFPTVIFTILLGIILLYWLLVILGTLDIDFIDIDELDSFLQTIHSGFTNIPFTIIFSLLVLCAWIISAIATRYILLSIEWHFGQFLVGFVVLLLSIWLATYIAVYLIIPLQAFLPKTETAHILNGRGLIGKVCVVTTAQVSTTAGQAEYNDGGAGLILTVRTIKPSVFLKKKDNALIIDYDANHNLYYVDFYDDTL